MELISDTSVNFIKRTNKTANLLKINVKKILFYGIN